MTGRKEWKCSRELNVAEFWPRPTPRLLGRWHWLNLGPFGLEGPEDGWLQLAAAADLESADSVLPALRQPGKTGRLLAMPQTRCGMALDVRADGNNRTDKRILRAVAQGI